MRRPLVIALVNNTPNRAMRTTERYFGNLLQAAAAGLNVRMALFTCRDRQAFAGKGTPADTPYRGLEELFALRPAGIIVTGMEPQAEALPDEPLWRPLTRLVDWAAAHAVPVVWSCLAAHAAVYYLDGIARVRLPGKLSGVYECEVVDPGHALLQGLPANWCAPHSRQNGLAEAALSVKGYQILSRSAEAGVDLFAKTDGVSFVFCQGHPEYDGTTLMREYQRDLRRYLSQEQPNHPTVPRHYLDRRTEAALEDLREQAIRGCDGISMFQSVSVLLGQAHYPDAWRPVAEKLYGNWLALVAAAHGDHGRRQVERRLALASSLHPTAEAAPVP